MSTHKNTPKAKTPQYMAINMVIKATLLLLMVALLSHCSNNRQTQVEPPLNQQIETEESLIHVTPMIPAAVKTLIQQADAQLAVGNVAEALLTLNRALSISSTSALVQQHLAEAYLTDGDYKQAMYWSTLVVNQGPDQGSLCDRSRRTQALAAEMLNQVEVQERALESIAGCSTQTPARY